jgi:hypothetical protein
MTRHKIHGPPLFEAEGPEFYDAALRHNQGWATHQAPWSTSLTTSEEEEFLHWGRDIDGKGHGFDWFGFDPERTQNDYDMRGFWLGTGGGGPAENGHFPDTWKTPYDTTFSGESKYALPGCPFKWVGEILVNIRSGQIIFAEPGWESLSFDDVEDELPDILAIPLDGSTGGKLSKQGARPAGAKGLAASIHDLKLHDGRQVTQLIGGSITRPPELVRTIEGATNLTIQITDPELRWLERSLAGEKWDCELDGLWFRYVGTTKSGSTMTLTFEDLVVARLREVVGPIRVYAHRGQDNEVTLAEFIIGLVERAPGPPIPTVCPQLEEQQPITTDRKAKKAKEESEEKRAKGVGDVKGLKVKGIAPTKAQSELIETGLEIAQSGGSHPRVATALVAALIDENNAEEPNVLQAEQEITGAGGEGAAVQSAVKEIRGFLTNEPEWTGEGADEYFAKHPDASPGEIAAAVQRNANGAADYDRFVAEARKWVEEFYGGTIEGSGTVTITAPKAFYVKGEGKRQKKRPETAWDAIQRYAKEVNWRAFADLGTFYYFDEEELSRGKVRLAIERRPGQRRPDNELVEDVDFKFQENAPINECTVTALAKKWGVAPGGVVTIAGYGPASLGAGDPVPKEPEKVGISSAVKASTHEGNGRYLVVKVTVPLVGETGTRRATISVRKASRPLPEGANQTTSLTIGKGSAEGNATVERILEGLENAAALEKPYVWGGEDPKTGVDCSGCVSFALRIGGFMEGRTNTEGLATFGEAGPGQFITVYDHAHTGDPETEHCAIEVAGVVFESGGGSENSNPNGGLGKVTEDVSGFLKQFEIKRHPKGF